MCDTFFEHNTLLFSVITSELLHDGIGVAYILISTFMHTCLNYSIVRKYIDSLANITNWRSIPLTYCTTIWMQLFINDE